MILQLFMVCFFKGTSTTSGFTNEVILQYRMGLLLEFGPVRSSETHRKKKKNLSCICSKKQIDSNLRVSHKSPCPKCALVT